MAALLICTVFLLQLSCFPLPESNTPLVAGLVVLGVATAAFAIGATFFAVKYFKSKRGQTEHGSDEPYYENQSGGNLPQVQSSAPPQYENYPHDGRLLSSTNTSILQGHSAALKPSTDNIPYENPDDLKSRADDTPYENPDDLNLHHPVDSIPRENHGDLNVNSPTDNSPNENPEAVTSEYLTISESGSTTENSHELSGQYENVNGRSNQYQTIHMSDISTTVNPYEEIRH